MKRNKCNRKERKRERKQEKIKNRKEAKKSRGEEGRARVSTELDSTSYRFQQEENRFRGKPIKNSRRQKGKETLTRGRENKGEERRKKKKEDKDKGIQMRQVNWREDREFARRFYAICQAEK